jgi:hypothetical protein
MEIKRTGVLIDTNNNIQNIELDMANGTNNIGVLLNDKITFIGQILREPEKCNAIIICGKNSFKNKLEINNYNIPPFNEKVYGNMFIICMDSNSEPQNFTVEDLEDYINNYEEKYNKNYHDL